MEPGNGGTNGGRLTRDLIVEAALELIDDAGLEALSMRMLAGVLGVKASSLYHHFASKDELLTGVAEFLYRTLGRPPDGGDWAEQLRGTFVQLRDFIQAHPNAAPLLVRELACSPVARRRANVLLSAVRRAGVDPVTSSSLVSNLVALLVGHAQLAVWVREESVLLGAPDGEHDEEGGAREGWIRGIVSAEESRRSRSMPMDSQFQMNSGLVTRLSTDLVFEGGLDALIRGFVPEE